jgi:uncharacterized repeat protein (TIGR01451 family)
MRSDFRFSRTSLVCRVLGISALIAVIIAAGCGAPAAPVAPAPVLTLSVTHTGNFSQGQQGATHTVTVSNTGTAPTSGTVTMTETVPAGLTLVSMAGTGWTCASATCTRADALATGSAYPTITVTVNVAASATSPQVNAVSVSGGGSATANASDSTTILTPVLSISKIHTGNFAQGQNGATYTVTVSNSSVAGTGPTNGTMVTVTDTVPSGLTLVSMAGTGWTCPTTCTRLDVLAAGASYPAITVTVNVAANAPTPQVNAVSVSGGGSANANTTDSTVIIQPVLSITKTHTGNFAQGQTGATYTVTVSNTGAASTSAKVTVTETVPSGLTLTGMTGTGWTCPGTGGPNTCDRSDVLANGSSYPTITVTVNVGASATSPQVNAVAVSGGGAAYGSTTDSTTITGGANSCGTGSESKLNGQYAFLMSGFDANGSVAIGGSFTADGTGKITAGQEDVNRITGVTNQPITTAVSSYSVGADNRGCLTIVTGGTTSTYRFALGFLTAGVAAKAHIVAFDATGTNVVGVIEKQNSVAFSLSAFNGDFAFGLVGTSSTVAGARFGQAGRFTINANGTITGGEIDVDDAGVPNHIAPSVTGTIALSANGRGTSTLSIGGGSVNQAFYVISQNEALLIGTDALSAGNGLYSGPVLKQVGGPFNVTSLNGTDILTLESGSGVTSDVQVGPLVSVQVGGSGDFGFITDENNGGTVTSNGPVNGSFTVAANGRVPFSTAGRSPVVYLVSQDKGFFVGTDTVVTTGFFEPQVGTNFTNASLSGNFIAGDQTPAVSASSLSSSLASLDGNGNVSVTTDQNTNGALTAGQVGSDTYAVQVSAGGTRNGRITLGSAPDTSVGYIVSSGKFVFISTKTTNTSPTIKVVEK